MPRTCSRSATQRWPIAWRPSSTRCAGATRRSRMCREALILGTTKDRRGDVVGVVADLEQVHVLGADLPALEQSLADPVHEPGPVVAAHQHDREVADLVGLAERDRLEQLVERAEAAGQHHEADRVAHEEQLAREEVVAGELAVEVWVLVLLERQLDVQADRRRSALLRAAV